MGVKRSAGAMQRSAGAMKQKAGAMQKTAGVPVRLPVGLFRDRIRHQTARLCPLAGHDELRVQQATAAGMPRVGLVTGLLAGCTVAIGDVADIDEALVEALCIGDREALLLHLRRLTFGEAIQAVVPCPGCAELLDLDLRIDDLLVAPAEACEPEPLITAEADGARWQVRLRRVTGADQSAALAGGDGEGELLRRCVLAIESGEGGSCPVEAMPAALVATLDARLAELDPQGEIRLDIRCPACRRPFSALFDAAGQLLAEIAAGAEQLIGEVATIARTFHWSERDILALPRPRRQAYAAWATMR